MTGLLVIFLAVVLLTASFNIAFYRDARRDGDSHKVAVRYMWNNMSALNWCALAWFGAFALFLWAVGVL